MCLDAVTMLILTDHKADDAAYKGDWYNMLMRTSEWFGYWHAV